MIVQASDGKFYRTAFWRNKEAAVLCEETEVSFCRVGKVGWRTAVKALTALGIRANYLSGPEVSTAIFQGVNEEFGRLLDCSKFIIRFRSPPPPPLASSQILESEPITDDEPIVKFKPRRKRCSGPASSVG